MKLLLSIPLFILLSVAAIAQQSSLDADVLDALQHSQNSPVISTQPLVLNNHANRMMAGCDSITTTYVSNNGLMGAMFDVVADSNLTINGMYTNLSVASGTFELYYKAGSMNGYAQNAAAWTLLGSANVVSNGVDVPTLLPIPFNITMNAGDTVAFYVTNTANSGFSGLKYTNGVGTGTLYVSNGALRIYEGQGITYPFANVYANRIWNGTLNYCTTTTGIDEIEQSFIALSPCPSENEITFSWDKQSANYIKIMSNDGRLVFEDFFGTSNKYQLKRHSMTSGIYYYQILNNQYVVATGKLIWQ